MEGPGKLRHVPAMALLLLLLLLAAKSSPGEARPVVGLRAVDHAAAMPAVGVALPKEAIGVELDHAQKKGCSMAAAVESQELLPSSVGGSMKGQKLAEEYGPLLLNLLPRGGVPPSAPSKGINDIKT